MHRLISHFALVVTFSVILVSNISANRVVLDTSLNGTGFKLDIPALLPMSTVIGSMVLQPDGKILFAGNTFPTSGAGSLVFARTNADGTLDPSFGTNGVTLIAGLNTGSVAKILLQPDGRIIAAGRAGNASGNLDFLALRLLPNGQLDTSFNGTGSVLIGSGINMSDECNALALQPDGKIVLSGRSFFLFQPTVSYDFSVARLNSDGTVDQTFDGDGIALFGTPDRSEESYAVAVMPSGKIVVGGSQQQVVGYRFMLAGFNSDGSVDTTFGVGGSNILPTQGGNQIIQTLLIQPSGRIVAAGR